MKTWLQDNDTEMCSTRMRVNLLLLEDLLEP